MGHASTGSGPPPCRRAQVGHAGAGSGRLLRLEQRTAAELADAAAAGAVAPPFLCALLAELARALGAAPPGRYLLTHAPGGAALALWRALPGELAVAEARARGPGPVPVGGVELGLTWRSCALTIVGLSRGARLQRRLALHAVGGARRAALPARCGAASGGGRGAARARRTPAGGLLAGCPEAARPRGQTARRRCAQGHAPPLPCDPAAGAGAGAFDLWAAHADSGAVDHDHVRVHLSPALCRESSAQLFPASAGERRQPPLCSHMGLWTRQRSRRRRRVPSFSARTIFSQLTNKAAVLTTPIGVVLTNGFRPHISRCMRPWRAATQVPFTPRRWRPSAPGVPQVPFTFPLRPAAPARASKRGRGRGRGGVRGGAGQGARAAKRARVRKLMPSAWTVGARRRLAPCHAGTPWPELSASRLQTRLLSRGHLSLLTELVRRCLVAGPALLSVGRASTSRAPPADALLQARPSQHALLHVPSEASW